MGYWVNTKGFPGYEINDDGEVRNKKTKKILKPYLNRPGGYYRVDINGKQVYVHKLMASSFFLKYEEGQRIRHINKKKTDNHLRNLDF